MIRSGTGTADLATAGSALRFGLLLPTGPASGLFAALGALGLARLALRFPLATLLATVAFAAQLGALLWIQPTMLSVPWILVRYLAHLLPLAALCIAAGAGVLLALVPGPRAREWSGAAAARPRWSFTPPTRSP